jgi:hypothetical protein
LAAADGHLAAARTKECSSCGWLVLRYRAAMRCLPVYGFRRQPAWAAWSYAHQIGPARQTLVGVAISICTSRALHSRCHKP